MQIRRAFLVALVGAILAWIPSCSAEECSRDSDCPDGSICASGVDTTFCSLLLRGQLCNASSECASGHCTVGRCAAGPETTVCGKDSDCESEHCVNGRCDYKPCVAAADCSSGFECVGVFDDTVSSDVRGEAFCLAPPGAACSTVSNFPPNCVSLDCKDGACACSEVGSPCRTDSDCCGMLTCPAGKTTDALTCSCRDSGESCSRDEDCCASESPVPKGTCRSAGNGPGACR